jgi:hypothetical protein
VIEISEILAPLDPWVIIMAVLLGMSLGVAMLRMGHRADIVHTYWQLAAGVVFFIPLSMLRAFQGSQVWERLLSTTALWALFVLGIGIGNRLFDRRWRNVGRYPDRRGRTKAR